MLGKQRHIEGVVSLLSLSRRRSISLELSLGILAQQLVHMVAPVWLDVEERFIDQGR